MNFRNGKDKFDFTELPSAYGNYGSYGTNHLKDDNNVIASNVMIYMLNLVRDFKENLKDYYDLDKTTEKIDYDAANEAIDELIDSLCGQISFDIVSMGDEEAAEHPEWFVDEENEGE